MSSGPNLREIILGQEGNFGLVTEGVLKIKPLPEARIFEGMIFPNYELGILFMNEVALKGIRPASLRLMDNI